LQAGHAALWTADARIGMVRPDRCRPLVAGSFRNI
jgi:hypothetical protein